MFHHLSQTNMFPSTDPYSYYSQIKRLKSALTQNSTTQTDINPQRAIPFPVEEKKNNIKSKIS